MCILFETSKFFIFRNLIFTLLSQSHLIYVNSTVGVLFCGYAVFIRKRSVLQQGDA